MRSFWPARSRRRLPLLATVGGAALALSLLLTLAAGIALRAPSVSVREAYSSLPSVQRSLTLTADSGDRAAQNRTVDRAVRRAFDGVPVRLVRTTRSGEASWTVSPEIPRLTTSDLPRLEQGFRRLPAAVDQALASSGGIVSSGGGARSTTTIRTAVLSVSETIAVPVSVLLAAAAVALAMLGRLLVASRAGEDRLLRSRGASSRLLVERSALEALAAGLPSVVIGGGIGQLALALRYGPPSGILEVAVPVCASLVAVVAAITATGLTGAVRPLGDQGDRTGRRGAATSWVVTVALLALAALCVWRYRGAQEPAEVLHDPLALLAPAAALGALAATATVLLGPVTRLLETTFSRGRRLPLSLAVRFVARNVTVLAAPALLITLAVGVGTVAAGSAATSHAFLDDSALLANGSSQRVSVGGSTALQGRASLLSKPLRASGASPALRTTAEVGDVATEVVGVDAERLPRLVSVDPHLFDADAVARRLAPDTTPRITLSGGAVTFRLATSTTAWSGDAHGAGVPVVTPTLWLVDRVGNTAPLTLSAAPIARSSSSLAVSSGALPEGGPWRLAGVDFAVSSGVGLTNPTVSVQAVSAGGHDVALPTSAWRVSTSVFSSGFTADQPLGVTAPSLRGGIAGGTSARLLPPGSSIVPIAVSQALSRTLGLHPGDRVVLSGQLAGFTGRVSSVVPVVPGTTGGPAVLADLPTLVRGYLASAQQLPRSREAWAPASTVLAGISPGSISRPSTHLEARFVRASTASLWLGAIGGGVFALLTIAATIAAIQRDRAPEVRVLRELGLGVRDQARVRVAETGIATLFALVTGAVAGILTTLLIAPTLARTGAPSAPLALPVQTSVDGASLALLIVSLVVGAALLLGGQYRSTRRAAGRDQ